MKQWSQEGFQTGMGYISPRRPTSKQAQ